MNRGATNMAGRKAIGIGGTLLILAAGIMGNIALAKNITKVNDDKEALILHNAKNELEDISKSDAAYILTDLYLYRSKGVRVATLSDGSDYETSGGIYQSSSRSYSSLIKEISKYEGENFVPMNPTSKEYNDVLELREHLSKNLLNSNVFKNKENPEVMEFAEFIEKNGKTEKVKLGLDNAGGMVFVSGLTLFSMVMFGMFLKEDNEKDEYYC
jgi:hypothetical protein